MFKFSRLPCAPTVSLYCLFVDSQFVCICSLGQWEHIVFIHSYPSEDLLFLVYALPCGHDRNAYAL